MGYIRAVVTASWVSGRGHVGVEGVRERLTVEDLSRCREALQAVELGVWGK